jgi:high-affinity iron transporter
MFHRLLSRVVRLPLVLASVALLAFVSAAPSNAATPQETVQTAWRLLDYVAVDYGGAVQNGRVVSDSEFAEMREFTATAERQLQSLPPTGARPSLLAEARDLRAAVDAKAPPADVATRARRLGVELLRAYPVPLAPTAPPDMARGAALYAQNCASCHGVAGHGDGPAARTLNPRPVNFTDRTRARERSTFGLEQVIAQLPPQDRWPLAFHVGTFAYPQADAARGKSLWESDAALRARLPDLAALAAVTPKALADQIGEDKANAVIAYLRSHPEAVQQQSGAGLTLTRAKLAESLAAYRAGNRDEAKRLALSAYLDGFEPVEPILAARDEGLMHRIEAGMGELRSRIDKGRPVEEVRAQAQSLDSFFAQAETALAPQASNEASTFLSALTILVREGVEALLIVVAMIAFLRKAGRTEVLPFVHGGWIAALVAGLATWAVATSLISISGASRELTEGIGGIFAAFVLVFVGIWMHGKAQADAWQRYVREKMDRALSRGSGWFLFGLAFVVVYREAFETILFYAAMWEDSPSAMLAGVIVGALLLAVIAWALLRYSRKLPIAQFFRYSSVLMAVLAVILAGKGVSAIQEAGLVGVTPVHGLPRLDVVGFQPSVQVIAAQLLALVALLVGFRLTRPKPTGASAAAA